MNFPAASLGSGFEKWKPWARSHLLAIKLATCRPFSTPSSVTLSPSVCAMATIRRTDRVVHRVFPRPAIKDLSIFKSSTGRSFT